MPHGGARPGAGRKPKTKVRLKFDGTPKGFFAAVMRHDGCSVADRLRAAIQLHEIERAEVASRDLDEQLGLPPT